LTIKPDFKYHSSLNNIQMEIKLDPSDLKPEFQKRTAEGIDASCPTSAINFEMLTPQAQEVVRIARKAVFYAWDKQTYKALFPVKQE
jgi:hypothetical protein